ncbi:MAG: ComEC/Rec2 family competence protein [Tannerella sp.]|jgi:competence protein ComEC|nr:ComEC/Rec2 family competence protein [Tannerella sp.]
MIAEELQKRPFARPLFLWITGILLQVCFPLQRLSVWLLLPVSAVLALSFCFSPKNAAPSYHSRWMWGVLFSCIMIFMSIQATAYAEQHLSDLREAGWLQRQAQAAQVRMAHKLDDLRLSDDEKAILATITISYRRMLSREIKQQFSTIGVSHILAVSGFHVGILYGFLSFLFSFFPKKNLFRWLRSILMLLSLWTFAFITGLCVATVRATLMSSIFVFGQIFHRPSERYNSLAVAAFILLAYNPFFLFDIGFQLSFIAVLFIFWLQPSLSRLAKVRNPLLAVPWDVLTITVAAQIGTTFLCCYYFERFSTVFLMSNLFLSLLATATIPLALIWMLLPDGIMSWLGILQWVIEQLMHCFVMFVERFSMVPGAVQSLPFDFVTLVCSYAALCFLLIYFRYRRTWMLNTSLCSVLMVICWHLYMRFTAFQ